MNVFRKLMKKKGFSLIELMIVVAIIGILAAIALPNFTRFQRKARQSEARSLLSGYHTALKATAAELGCFKGNFVAIGFAPEGELYYRITTANNAGCILPTASASIDDPACIDTTQACNAAGINYVKNWTERATVVAGGTAVAMTNNTYSARSAGDLGGTQFDEWAVNEAKDMRNVQSGL